MQVITGTRIAAEVIEGRRGEGEGEGEGEIGREQSIREE
jgi:hypothetical protein